MVRYTVVPVLCIIDVLAILADPENYPPGTIDNPTNLGTYGASDVFVSMVSSRSFLNGGPSGISELALFVPQGQVIQILITTLIPEAYSATLIGINPNTPGVLQGGSEVALPVHDYQSGASSDPQLQTYTEYGIREWVSGEVGSITGFNVVFRLFDFYGKDCGYYYWDPSVTVTEKV